jgi:transcriptional regulator with PAS, ATPase and Fis domain
MLDPAKIEDQTPYPLDELIPDDPVTFGSPEMQGYRLFSQGMKEIFSELKKMSGTRSVPLMITGKTGSGKEVVARFMHHEVDRNQGEFIAVNCTNINQDMFESELFGYKKGAFTGASTSGHEGYLSQASEGTLFLDEIGEINLNLQAKLLRVLEEGEYYKLGSAKKERVNARLVFASNRDLKTMLKEGSLREDLYYRLNVVGVEVPELKDRKEEIIPMACLFIERYNKEFQKQVRFIQGKVLKFFYQYNWPGNIRELKNLITQMMIFMEGDTVRFDHLQAKDEMDRLQTLNLTEDYYNARRSEEQIIQELIKKPFNLEEFTLKVVRQALYKFRGNKAQTARFLGLKREQLYNRYRTDE